MTIVLINLLLFISFLVIILFCLFSEKYLALGNGRATELCAPWVNLFDLVCQPPPPPPSLPSSPLLFT